ncbi:TatD family hydrolase [Bacillus sp. RG28]|uniref:TatD family hydrolase n=1 Tax=Gottfriedia endophytica TaxID=2820819 RepID=A0A940NL01_9BACI|nr:TatD family hydrolase [Gottfriedia endophytica]MBP0724109.1 TatD family hydrolase [Gottfriedia endophytica]
MKVFDAHIHFDKYEENDRQKIIESLSSNKIEGLINVSMDLASCQENLKIAEVNPTIYPAFGFHPEQAIPSDGDVTEMFDWIGKHQDKMVAVGEVGLPYYLRTQENNSRFPYQQYVDLLEEFIKLAKKLDKPIILHAVYNDAPVVCDLLEKHTIERAHFHWFKGDQKTMERLIRNGFYVSLTPDILYEEETREVVKTFPLDLIMSETDGPWPFEGIFTNQMTHPKMVHHVVREISEMKNISLNEVYSLLYENVRWFYRIK